MRQLHTVLSRVVVATLLSNLAVAQATVRASVGSGGVQTNGHSSEILRNRASLSGDGRYVAFESQASNLIAGDTNGMGDIFVRDLVGGLTTRVSVGPGGAQITQSSMAPEITADGRFVLFTSTANGIVLADTNFTEDVYLHDRVSGTTTLVSASTSGAPTGLCWIPALTSPYRRPMSGDARFAAFATPTTNVVAGDTNNAPDVFVRDLQLGTTTRISVDAFGGQVAGTSVAPSMTSDARFVVFESNAALVTTDTNGVYDVYVVERATGFVERVSTSSTGSQGNFMSFDASISDDGRFVAFQSAATNLVVGDTNMLNDVFVKDRASGALVRANVRVDGSQPTTSAEGPMLSRDGRCVVFWSFDPLLVPGDTNGVGDVFVRDLSLGITRCASLGTTGAHGDAAAYFPDLSSNGVVASFSSVATNLVPGDTNAKFDVFVRDAAAAGPVVFCNAKLNSAGCWPRVSFSGTPTIGAGSFSISASAVLNQKSGLLFYGLGQASVPFFGGTRCVELPLRRTPVQNSAGNPPPDDCSGTYVFDMRGHILSGIDPTLVVGAAVAAQFWSRDPLSTHGAGLTDAVSFVVSP